MDESVDYRDPDSWSRIVELLVRTPPVPSGSADVHHCGPDWSWRPRIPDFDLWLVFDGVGRGRLNDGIDLRLEPGSLQVLRLRNDHRTYVLTTLAGKRGAVTTISRLAGLAEDFVDRCDLRVSPGRFYTELLRDKRLVVSRMDGRFTGWDVRSTAVFKERLFFGAPEGQVMIALSGGQDGGEPYAGV
jgi:hypothetical protein